MEYGVQIFGCLAECKKNPDAFFRTLSEAGYKQIEPCVLFDDPAEMAENARLSGNEFMMRLSETIWKPEELPSYIEIMGRYGLELSSVHVFVSNMLAAADRMVEAAKKNKISAYVVNCNQQTVVSEYREFAGECSRLSGVLNEYGIELWLHNNGVEIKNRVEHNGRKVPILSAILELCREDRVGAQIDVGWILYGGIDPVAYLLDMKDYIRSVHFKDLKKDFAARTDGDIFACLGEGALEVSKIMDCIPQLGASTTVLVDQDASDMDIMEDMRKSYQVLRSAR
jgi:sugar phosphate isomerase/epimerase